MRRIEMKPRFFAVFLMVVLDLSVWGFAGESKEEEPFLPPQAFETARKALIRVEIFFKKPERPEEKELEESELGYRGTQKFVEKKRSKNLVGAVVNDEGDILIPEIRLDKATLDRIEVVSSGGERRKAHIKAILIDAPSMFLEIEGSIPASLRPPSFVPPPPFGKERLKIIRLSYAGVRWVLTAYSVWQGTAYESRDAQPFLHCILPNDEVALLFAPSGAPVGITITSRLEDSEESGLWKGKSLLNAKTIPYSEYEKFRKQWAKAYDGVIHEVKIEFRKKARHDTGIGGFWGRMLGAEQEKRDASMREIKAYGPAISERCLFVPVALSQTRAKLIDKITVSVGGKKLKARFLGAFKPFVGFLVELEDGKFPQIADLSQATPIKRLKPFYALRAQEKLGGKRILVHFNRWLTKTRGYKNVYHWTPLHPIDAGDFILDTDGRLAGAWLTQRIEGAEIRRAARAQSFRLFGREISDYGNWGYASAGSERFYGAKYLAKTFASPDEAFDPTIVALSKKEEKRRMWLGVEFESLNKELAKSLKVEKPTLDGSIGLMVSTVYDNSPAARLGIKPNDILLRIKPEGETVSVDLKQSGEDYDFSLSDADIPPQLQSMGFKLPEKAPWRGRGNYVNNLLDVIGEGRTITLTYISDGELTSGTLKVERAPVDFDSAPKFKDKELGLTAKDVTYEVRKALDMKPDEPGVVIAKVEEGSPAAVARLAQYEIIAQVAAKPVRSAKEFGDAIESARKAGKETVQLQVIKLGKARFADLQLKKP